MTSTVERCQICNDAKLKYTCPKCNIGYCSVLCYKSTQHLKCSEEFYKDCVKNELATSGQESSDDIKKIYDILKRMRDIDSGLQAGNDFENDLDELIDSDDEPAGEEEAGCEEEDDDADLALRLREVNINDSDEVWQRLTASERRDFQQMVETGDITKLLPAYNPWWVKRQNSKIVDLSTQQTDESDNKPKLAENIPKFGDICKKTPSTCLHYNLWNMVAAYACTMRFFGGEHLSSSWEAASHLVNLSVTLKYNTNFEDVEDALVSVHMEGLSTVDREEMQQDAKQLMMSRQYKALALSDMLQLLKMAKQQTKNAKTEDTEFQKLYAMCSGNVELSRKRLHELVKKIEFMLSYVMREPEEELH